MKTEKTNKLIEEVVDYIGSDMWPHRTMRFSMKPNEEPNETGRLLKIGRMIEWAVNTDTPFVRTSASMVVVNKGDLEILEHLYKEFFEIQNDHLEVSE